MNQEKNQYPKTMLSAIKEAFEKDRKANQKPIAAFDADGTLWNTDLGESFFQYQIKNKLVPLPSDPWRHYREWKESGDPRPAYLWLAQINEGKSLSQVKEWAEKCIVEQEPLAFFEEQKLLVKHLLDWGVKVFVVTASVKWAVEPGALRLGIPEEQVLGVATQVDSHGNLTRRQEGAMTFREGKAQALLAATKGQRPFFCSGNTMGDFNLLESSTGLALAVSSAQKGEELFRTEQELKQVAQERAWLSWNFG